LVSAQSTPLVVARDRLEARRWPDGPRCPRCRAGDRVVKRANGYHRCLDCRHDFTVRAGTVLARSRVPLDAWLYCMAVLVEVGRGATAAQIAKAAEVTPKTALFMRRRLRPVLITLEPWPRNLDEMIDAVLRPGGRT